MPEGVPLQELSAPEASARILLKNKKALEQVQICWGVPAPPVTDDSRYATLILNTVLGGGMSSRLFQTIREERGMAYSIYSDLSPYRDTGTLCVYAGTSAGKALEVVDLILAEFRNLKETALGSEELTRAKDQLKGNILMGLESSNSRMANLARQEMYFQKLHDGGRGHRAHRAGGCGTGTGDGAAAVCAGPDRGDDAGAAGTE